jgi:hypothetical protein
MVCSLSYLSKKEKASHKSVEGSFLMQERLKNGVKQPANELERQSHDLSYKIEDPA